MSVFSVLPESTEYVTGKKLSILNLVDLVTHVLKTLFHLAPVRSLQTLPFSASTHNHEHICQSMLLTANSSGNYC